ncbi:MAG: glycosyltransferase family 2 protein [Cyanobium sp.]
MTAARAATDPGTIIPGTTAPTAIEASEIEANRIAAAATPPQVAVITPYHREDLGLLAQAHRSVLAQTIPALHVLVADGHPRAEIDGWQAHHVVLPVSHGDIGSTPRLIGSYHAIGLGVEAIAFLDADNWYAPTHLEALMACRRREGAAFVSSSRLLCRLDGSPMAPCPLTDPERFIDTNCMLFGRGAFPLLHHWGLMPDYGHLIGDRILLHHVIRSGVRRAHLNEPSVHYRCSKEGLYRQLGEPIPAGVQPRPDYESSLRRWQEDGHPPL